MKKAKGWLLPIVSLLVAAIILATVFWDVILVRAAPKVVLSSALTEAAVQLKSRFQKDPLLIVGKTLEPDGKYTIDGSLRTNNALLGAVQCDMTLRTNAQLHQLFVSGSTAASERDLDFSLYMDPEYVAISSQKLVEGNYYGITYDTFAADIRSIPLLNVFISETVFSRWEGAVRMLQEQISRDYPMPYLPELSEKDMQSLLLGILALPCEIEERTISLSDTAVECVALTYLLEGETLDAIWRKDTDSENHTVEISFYLYERSLVYLQCKMLSGADAVQCSLQLGIEPQQDPLMLQYADSSHQAFSAAVTTVQEDECFKERWDIRTKGECTVISYDWEPSTGKMRLFRNDEEEAVVLYLKEKDNGFFLETDRLDMLLRIFDSEGEQWQPVSCSMSVECGSEIMAPGYKNLDQWSLEDFLSLAEGIGVWIGLRFN